MKLPSTRWEHRICSRGTFVIANILVNFLERGVKRRERRKARGEKDMKEGDERYTKIGYKDSNDGSNGCSDVLLIHL